MGNRPWSNACHVLRSSHILVAEQTPGLLEAGACGPRVSEVGLEGRSDAGKAGALLMVQVRVHAVCAFQPHGGTTSGHAQHSTALRPTVSLLSSHCPARRAYTNLELEREMPWLGAP